MCCGGRHVGNLNSTSPALGIAVTATHHQSRIAHAGHHSSATQLQEFLWGRDTYLKLGRGWGAAIQHTHLPDLGEQCVPVRAALCLALLPTCLFGVVSLG